MGWSNSGSDDDEDRSPVVWEERNDLWKFPISIILNVRAERYNRGSGVSKDAIMGVRKCYKNNISICLKKVRVNSLNKPDPTHPHTPSPYHRIHARPSVSC